MARISVEQTVLTDLRYQTLGRIFRKEKRWARGVMMEVWNQCQELETHTLSRQDILDLCPDIKGFADALIAASLADEQEDGSLYIRGTKGRIEWLGKLRGNARFGALGGPSGVKGGRPKQTPIRGLEETPIRGLENNPPPAPAPAPAPSPPTPSRGRRAGLVKVSPFLTNPPSHEEVQSYLASIHAPFDAQEFFDGMINCQWTHSKGTQPIIDWKATVRTWIKMRRQNAAPPVRPQMRELSDAGLAPMVKP